MVHCHSFQKKLRLAFSLLVGFLFLTCLAMVVYPGGTIANPVANSYMFSENFFSDLGRLTTFNGSSNVLSCIIFASAMLMAAVGQSLYLSMKWQILQSSSRVFALFGCLFGFIATAGQIGVAMTPGDLLGKIHMDFVYLLFCSFLISSSFFMIAIFKTKHYPNIYGWAFAGFGILLASYVLLLFYGPSIRTQTGLMIHAVAQKIIVYAQVLSIGIQLFGIRSLAAELLPFQPESEATHPRPIETH